MAYLTGSYSPSNPTTIIDDHTNNFFIGTNAGNTTLTGTKHVMVGIGAGNSLTSSNNSVGVGWHALNLLTTGTASTAVGEQALRFATTGGSNSAFGANSLQNLTTGSSNLGVGNSSLASLTTGSSNVAIGSGAAGLVLSTGSNNIYIGTLVTANSSSESNTMRLGLPGTILTTIIAASPITNELTPPAAGTTITAAAIAGGIFIANGDSTTDTAANIDTQIPAIRTNNVIKCLVTNSTILPVSVTGGTNVTINGTISIASNDSRLLYFQRTGIGAYTVY